MIYDFLTGLNPKFDVLCERILGQRPIPSPMEVCSEIRLEENRTSTMNISATHAIDSATFNVRSSTSGSDKHNGKPVSVCEHCNEQWHTKDQYWKLHGRSLRGKSALPTTNVTQGGLM